MQVSAYEWAVDFMRYADVLRVMAHVHEQPTLALVESCNEARRQYDHARFPGRRVDPDRTVDRPPHRIDLVPMAGGLFRAACSCGEYRSGPTFREYARKYGLMHTRAMEKRDDL